MVYRRTRMCVCDVCGWGMLSNRVYALFVYDVQNILYTLDIGFYAYLIL